MNIRDTRLPILLLAAVAGFHMITLLLSLGNLNDMHIFRDAAVALQNGRNIFLERYREGYAYYYGIPFALLLGLFKSAPLWTLQLSWGLLQLGLLARIHLVLERWTGVDRLPMRRRLLVHATAAFLSLQVVRDNLNAAQSTILLCWCCVEVLHQVLSGRHALAALLLAAGIDLKLLPLVMVPYLAYRAEWRTLLLLPLFLLLIWTLPAATIGTELQQDLLSARWSLLNPAQQQHQLDDEEPDFVSLGSVVSAYFGDGSVNDHGVRLPRRLLSMAPPSLSQLLLATRLTLVLAMLWFLRTKPFLPAISGAHRAWEIGYLLACVPLIFPHQQSYSVLFVLPLLFHLCSRWIGPDRTGRSTRAAIIVVFVGFNAHLLLGEFGWVFDHYKVLSLALVCALLGSAFLGPRTAAEGPVGRVA